MDLDASTLPQQVLGEAAAEHADRRDLRLPGRLRIVGRIPLSPWRHALRGNFPQTDLEAEAFKQIARLCGAGLLVSLILMSYGLDLSPGFF
jgi:hypothetical protein